MELNINKMIKIITSHILIILLCSFILAAGSFSYTYYYSNPSYTSSMKLMLISEHGISNYTDITTMRRMVNTYVEMLDSRDFYEQLKSSVPYSAANLKNMIKYSTNEDSEAFVVSVTAPTKNDCTAIISAFNKSAESYINQKYKTIALNTVESPSVPIQNSNNLIEKTAFGFFIGFLLSSFVFIMVDYFDTKIKSENDLSERYDIPILGTVPDFQIKKVKKKRR